LRQADLEKALLSSRKGKRAANRSLQSSQIPVWALPSDSDDSQVRSAIYEISNLMSRIAQSREPESQDNEEPSSP
jgi:ATPase family AAA domain-containing protein 1